jgi:hypothetical protein
VEHKRKHGGRIANEDGIKVSEQFIELLLNYCRESKEILSQHKSKAWHHLASDYVTKYRIVLTTNSKAICAIFDNTLAKFSIVLAVFCSNTQFSVNVAKNCTLLFKIEHVRYFCCSINLKHVYVNLVTINFKIFNILEIYLKIVISLL